MLYSQHKSQTFITYAQNVYFFTTQLLQIRQLHCIPPPLKRNFTQQLCFNEHILVQTWPQSGLTLMSNCPEDVWGFLYAYNTQIPRPVTSAMMNRIPIIPEIPTDTLWSPVNSSDTYYSM